MEEEKLNNIWEKKEETQKREKPLLLFRFIKMYKECCPKITEVVGYYV